MSRILVADDDASVLDSIAYTLEREAFDVDTVADGEAALHALRDFGYDLAILNVMMPRLFGTDVLREMQLRNGMAVVLLSARDARADRIEGLELGADDYITKPFSLQELVSRVRAILRRQARGRHSRLQPPSKTRNRRDRDRAWRGLSPARLIRKQIHTLAGGSES